MDRDAVIQFLERTDVALPDRLTLEKITSRGSWWAIGEASFSFRIERHPSGPFLSISPSGRGMPTPARWHIRTRYTYDLATDEWDSTEVRREFAFDAGLPVDAEFEQFPRKHLWDQALARAKAAEDPVDVLEDQLAFTQQLYRDSVPHKARQLTASET